MSVLESCPSYRESNKGSKERQGPTLGVRLKEVSIKRESTALVLSILLFFIIFWTSYYMACSVIVPGLLAKFVNE